MTTSTIVRSSESNFKLTRRIVETLSEKYGFTFEEGWQAVCDSSVEYLTRKFKRERRRNNPYSSVKKPRTSFSFFTQERRAQIATKNPKATFGELSKLVSVAWKALSTKERKRFQDMEAKDKIRYQTERDAVRLQLESAANETVTTTETVAEPVVETPAATTTTKKRSGKRTTGKTARPAAKTTTKPAEPATTTTARKPSSYNNFQKQIRPQLKQQFPDAALKEINSKLGAAWSALDETQRTQYVSA